MAVYVIGLGLSYKNLTKEHIEIIDQADILVGGKRHLDYFENYCGQKIKITKDIDGIISFIKDYADKKCIVVLASGDPLFFGIGARIVTSIGKERVKVYPNFSSVSAGFAKIGESWDDAAIISMHGKDQEKDLKEAVLSKIKIAVLTDYKRTPAYIASLISDYLSKDTVFYIFERLGSSDEKVYTLDFVQVLEKDFKQPNFLIIVQKKKELKISEKGFFGMDDSCFVHEKGLITKAEVRAVTLSKLRLDSSDLVLWDLGAGSGSISIEASIFIKTGKIIAVEKKESRIKQIKENIKSFKVFSNIDVVSLDLPSGMNELKLPDRIFIGGGGRDLEKIAKRAVSFLKPDGVIVINTVLMDNINIVCNMLDKSGLKTEIVQIQINRGKEMPWGKRFEALNPVWIITGKK